MRDELSTSDAKISINITDISHPTDRVSIAENSKSSAVTGTSDMDMSTSTITSSVLEVDNHLYELQRTSSSPVISSEVKSNIISPKDIIIIKQHSKVDFNGDDVSPLSSYLSLPKKTIHIAMKHSNNTDPCQNIHVSLQSTTSTNNNTVVIPPPPPLQQKSQGELSPTIIIPHLEVDQ